MDDDGGVGVVSVHDRSVRERSVWETSMHLHPSLPPKEEEEAADEPTIVVVALLIMSIIWFM